MKFYNMKTKTSIEVTDNSLMTKKKLPTKNGYRYMIQAVLADGTKLSTMTNEATWKTVDCKEVAV